MDVRSPLSSYGVCCCLEGIIGFPEGESRLDRSHVYIDGTVTFIDGLLSPHRYIRLERMSNRIK